MEIMDGEVGRDAKSVARDLVLPTGRSPRSRGVDLDGLRRELAALATEGDVEAQTLLGGVELDIGKNYEAAYRWFEKSADAGDPAGQRSLGYLYANGFGVAVDLRKAVELYRSASAAGDLFAMYNLAAVNIREGGSYLTYQETVDLLERAAAGGIVAATARLGDLFAANDRDVEALDYYLQAASQGHLGAMNAAACWYRDGIAGDRDPVQAVRWFLEMLKHGDGDGMHEAGEVAQSMTDEQIREAAALADSAADGEAIIFSLHS